MKAVQFFIVIFCLGLIVHLGGLEMDLPTQFVLGFSLTALVLLLVLLPLSQRLEIRLLILFLGAFLALRYIIWRTTNTLIFTSLADFVPMMALYVAELYSLTVFLFGLIINVLPLERPPVAPFDPERGYPFVDVLIPTFTEPVDLVKITLMGCALLDYPKDRLRIFLLDDGATHQRLTSRDEEIRKEAHARKKFFEALCKDLGVEYRSRKKNHHAKAGNINEALSECQGDLVLILDCDHVPTRDFLKRTVGFFQEDERLFLVQTPHFMINANPVEKNLGLFADAPSESEMFYGVIQKGLDFWNSSFFCGSAALLRRSFLEKIGGISGKTVTEDAETSLELHSQGLRSLYFANPVTSGLSPETFRDFINQRIRWAQGMIQILLLKNPFLKKGLKWYQRIGYANSSIFWFFGLARFIFIVSPLLYFFFGLRIYMASVPQVLAYALPFLVSSFYISNFLFGKYRWPLFSELYETAQSIFLLPAVFSVLFHPHSPRFKVTPKGQSLVKDFVSPLGWPLLFLFMACTAAIPFVFYRWNVSPLDRDVVIICTVWLFFHMTLLLMCIGSVFERHQWRRHPRTWAQGEVFLSNDAKGKMANGKVVDLSLGGMGAIVSEEAPFETGEVVILKVTDGYGNSYKIRAKVLRIRSIPERGKKIALEFISEGLSDLKKIVSYVYGDSNRWEQYQARKRKKVPLMQGVFYLVRHGLSGARFAILEIARLIFKTRFSIRPIKKNTGPVGGAGARIS